MACHGSCTVERVILEDVPGLIRAWKARVAGHTGQMEGRPGWLSSSKNGTKERGGLDYRNGYY